jgi:hypothetical protein
MTVFAGVLSTYDGIFHRIGKTREGPGDRRYMVRLLNNLFRYRPMLKYNVLFCLLFFLSSNVMIYDTVILLHALLGILVEILWNSTM